MQLTTNYSLRKIELTDPIDITAINPNWETIDAKLKEADTKITNVASGQAMRLVDETTGKVYKLVINDGKLFLEEVS